MAFEIRRVSDLDNPDDYEVLYKLEEPNVNRVTLLSQQGPAGSVGVQDLTYVNLFIETHDPVGPRNLVDVERQSQADDAERRQEAAREHGLAFDQNNPDHFTDADRRHVAAAEGREAPQQGDPKSVWDSFAVATGLAEDQTEAESLSKEQVVQRAQERQNQQNQQEVQAQPAETQDTVSWGQTVPEESEEPFFGDQV